MVELGKTSAHPDDHNEDFRCDDHVDEVREKAEAKHRGDVLLGPRRQENNLVSEAHHDDEHRVNHQRPLRHHPGATVRKARYVIS